MTDHTPALQRPATRTARLSAIEQALLTRIVTSQSQLSQILADQGIEVTQATLSSDLKQLKVAKAASMNGKYVYVLPNETMYRRIPSPRAASEMLQIPGYRSINFSGNIGVIRTRPGYASSIAYNIDNGNISEIIGTIAGDDTIIIVVKEGAMPDDVVRSLAGIVPGIE